MSREKKKSEKEGEKRLSTRQFIGAKGDYRLQSGDLRTGGAGVFYCKTNEYFCFVRI